MAKCEPSLELHSRFFWFCFCFNVRVREMVWKLRQKVRKMPLASLGPTVQEVGEKAWSPLDGAAGEEEPLGRVQLQFTQDGRDSVLRSCKHRRVC